jgi:preprotein translocase subunit SecB
MAENENNGGQQMAATDGAAPRANIVAQYVKDISFENPNAPESFKDLQGKSPRIHVDVNVTGRKIGDDSHEVALRISATADLDDKSVFVVELVYAGQFVIENLPEETLEAFMLVQAPVMLFPFARQIIASATSDGGYPPLLLEPIDFPGLYRQQLLQRQAEATGEATEPVTT